MVDNNNREAVIKQQSIVSRLQINDNKAGMENIDKEKINSIIMKHTLSTVLTA